MARHRFAPWAPSTCVTIFHGNPVITAMITPAEQIHATIKMQEKQMSPQPGCDAPFFCSPVLNPLGYTGGFKHTTTAPSPETTLKNTSRALKPTAKTSAKPSSMRIHPSKSNSLNHQPHTLTSDGHVHTTLLQKPSPLMKSVTSSNTLSNSPQVRDAIMASTSTSSPDSTNNGATCA